MIDYSKSPPRFSKSEIQIFVKDYYGIEATAKNLVSDIGQNFHLRTEEGISYIFKIANPAENKDMIEAQNYTLDFLGDHQLKIPNLILATDGSSITSIKDKKGEIYSSRLFSYLNGSFLADIRSFNDQVLARLGEFIGKMDNVLLDVRHPAIHRSWHWDLKNLSNIWEYTSFIVDAEKRRLAEYFILQFETEVMPKFPRLRQSLIHNDANDYNILIKYETEDSAPGVGIIDFGDMVFTHTIFELAVCLAYTLFDNEDPLAVAEPVIKSYHSQLPLTDLEIDILYYCICARLCLSVTIAAYQREKQPDNDYVSISEQSAWDLLVKMLEINPKRASAKFREACNMDETGSEGLDIETIYKKRHEYIGRSLSISYEQPLKIIRGAMQYLYNDTGNTYLDCVNNVCHVGHCHPRVVKAAQQQLAVLNTNTRYLHDYLVQYAERLSATMPNPLSVCFFVCTGSEANELALRLARTHTKQKDIIVVEGAYHGNTSSVIEISPYKFDGPAGGGSEPYIHKTIMPDPYRGPYKGYSSYSGEKYAGHLKIIIDKILEENKGIAAFICESMLGCGGQIVLPDNYMKTAFEFVRQAGGVCIADEVQVGFGRPGSHFWAFESQDVIPDIVTLGKPIGNGHPLAAVITTPEIAESFNNGMEYFNTYGGNPVSCAVGLAVLEIVKEEGLQEHALQVGNYLKSGLKDLMSKHQIIGDVRGLGLFIGVELVRDRETLEPAAEEATQVIEQMKDQGILVSTDGPLHNVLKIKPPLVFNKENAKFFVEILDQILTDL